jgi:hypothetical protein
VEIVVLKQPCRPHHGVFAETAPGLAGQYFERSIAEPSL